MILAGITKVLGENNLSHCHFANHVSHEDWPEVEPYRPCQAASD